MSNSKQCTCSQPTSTLPETHSFHAWQPRSLSVLRAHLFGDGGNKTYGLWKNRHHCAHGASQQGRLCPHCCGGSGQAGTWLLLLLLLPAHGAAQPRAWRTRTEASTGQPEVSVMAFGVSLHCPTTGAGRRCWDQLWLAQCC